MRRAAAITLAALCIAAAPVIDQPAIDTRATIPPAQGREIHTLIVGLFGLDACPAIIRMVRLERGMIKTYCINLESFLVFSHGGNSSAMRCTDAKRQGIFC